MKNIFDSRQKQKFIELSRELIGMDERERKEFFTDQENFRKEEKAYVLDTFICVLEQVEDYETCAGLLQLKHSLLAA